MTFDHDEIMAEFLVEAFEGLDKLDQELIQLEQAPEDAELINSIFRTVHTIKGTCGFLELHKLEHIAHVGENLLDSLRAGRARVTELVASALLELTDAFRTILNSIEASGSEGENAYEALALKLQSLNDSCGASTGAEALAATESESQTESVAEVEAQPQEALSNSEQNESEDLTNHELLAELMASEELAEQAAEQHGAEQHGAEQVEESQVAVAEDLTNHELLAELMASEELAEQAAEQPSTEQVEESQAAVAEDLTNHELLAELMASEELAEQAAEQPQAEQVEEPQSAVTEDMANHELLAELMGSTDQQQITPAAANLQANSKTDLSSDTSTQTDVGELLVDLDKSLERHRSGTALDSSANASQGRADQLINQQSQESSEVKPGAQQSQKMETDDMNSSIDEQDSSAKSPTDSSDRASSNKAAAAAGSLTDSSIRVDVALLDQVMNLVGELVLARNQILQFTKTQTDSSFVNTCQRLNLITSELQEGVMKTRMQPIANVWNKFPRVVRDVARACGKEIKIEMEGKETELDKTILEAIKDPLTHIVRNSADHGIEAPDVREKKGKPREGTLLLKAYHEGGHVIIQIEDDGGGIDPARIKSKAIEKGVISEAQASRMSDSELQKLIFAAGFSTAEKITNVSGRGVGMDVVRSNIEKIGGTVDVQSVVGRGTTLFIKIPLTLAIVPALIVSSSSQRFAIPQVSLLELVRLESERLNKEVETLNGKQFYRLRGNLLPLVFLREELAMLDAHLAEPQKQQELSYNIVVVRAEGQEFGIVVDTVHDTEEIVVKPLGKQLKDIDVFAGATIMGDGKVALIMDVQGLARRAEVVGDMKQESERSSADDYSESDSHLDNKQTLLIVRVGRDYRMAIPLEQVDRLEEFEVAQLEHASGKQVIQYRGGILPLIDLGQIFDAQAQQSRELIPVVVYSDSQRSVGLVVESILDIVEENIVTQTRQNKRGISGSAVVQSKVTDLLDIAAVLEQAEIAQQSLHSSENRFESGRI